MNFTRRQLLQNSAAGFGMMALNAMLQTEGNAEEKTVAVASGPLAPKPVHFPARAKRVIFLFMKGGPSHVDTFDPKPALQRDDGKPFPFEKPRVQFAPTGNLLKSPWKFKKYGESGIEVSELFPHVAQHVDDLCILNSVHGTNAAHGGALLKLHTGSDNFVRPSMGSWITYGLGTENQNLPGFVTICPTLAHGGVKNWGASFLPAAHQGTPIGNASITSEQAKVRYIRNASKSHALQRMQLDLLGEMNREHIQQTGPNLALEGRINSFELAFRMQNEMPQVQDLSNETADTLKLYGMDEKSTTDFGRQCLLARRYAERGVRFVQVTHSNSEVQWDQHGDLKKGHEQNAQEVDKPIAGLLQDLKQRGLLEDTLVMWGGEFGRTPTVQGKNGRDHNPDGFTMWLAGGGVKSGTRYGTTDEYGYYAQQDKLHIHDLHATLLHLLGLDHKKLTYRYAGRDFRLTDVAGKVAHGIFA
ncbi:MAG: sulfatase [Blastopirellula sp.]|nr:MAG: sulfatase [Blastopirellula sp.]